MNGLSATAFGPNGQMSRAMLVTVLYRMAGSPGHSGYQPFADVAAGTWYTDAVIWANQTGITTGTSATAFSPNANVSREQLVTFFYRYAKICGKEMSVGALSGWADQSLVDSYAVEAFGWAIANGIVSGVVNGCLDPNGNATRAQCAAIMQRFIAWLNAAPSTTPETTPTQPEATEPAATEPAATEPATEPTTPVTEPAATEPAATEPATVPTETEPAATEPTATEPTVTEPQETEPEETEPEETIPEKTLHLSKNGIYTYDTGYMRKNLTAVELTRLMGNGTNLGNTLEACNAYTGSTFSDPTYYETMWGQPVTTQAMISGMKAAGFDTIRIPIAWMTNATDLAEGNYIISDAYFDRVEEVINYALNADMYVIINDHWDGGWYGMFGSESQETRDLAMEAYKSMWTQIAERFKEYSDYLIFEGANEELGDRLDENSTLYCSDSTTSYYTTSQAYELVNQINQVFVDTVRATGGNNATRFLLIPGYNTNIDKTVNSRFEMPTDTVENRLLVSVHYYDPWSYCGETQSPSKWGTASDIQSMDNTLKKLSKFTEAGYGVVIGEYGVLYSSTMKDNTLVYHQTFLDLCDMYDFTSCLWDCSSFYNRRTLKMVDDELAALYKGRNVQAQANMSVEAIKSAASASYNATLAAAPATLN